MKSYEKSVKSLDEIQRFRNPHTHFWEQGGGTLLQSVLRAATAVKIKVNGQLEIFSIVNSQATISL